MAKYKVNRINYITVGKSQHLLNMDVNRLDTNYSQFVLGTGDKLDNKPILNKNNLKFRIITRNNEGTGNLESTLESRTYITNDGENGIFGGSDTHIFSIKQTDKASDITKNGILIDPLYLINDICIKSSVKKPENLQKISSKKTSDDFVDIYAPVISDEFVYMCQYGTYTLALTHRTTNGPNYLQTNLATLNNELSNSIDNTIYSWEINSQQIKTYLYNTKDTLNDKNSEELSNYFKPKYNLVGLKYNYILEIPNVLDYNVYNDYESGDIQGDFVQAKNQYDAKYSINMPSISSIQNARDYIGIDVCGNQPYLKFYDNVNYNTSLNIQTKTNNFDDIQSVGISEDSYKVYPFQKIETFDYINRFRNVSKHKSPLYSLKINKTGLSYIKDSDARIKIKKEITNNIREITKKLCPAQTQLFNVYFSED